MFQTMSQIHKKLNIVVKQFRYITFTDEDDIEQNMYNCTVPHMINVILFVTQYMRLNISSYHLLQNLILLRFALTAWKLTIIDQF